ncbi:hypothetical protein, partial [Xanthomonas oryzae]|uniref:hypothetical protein n=1 Tax=Xanthomonas oryzae TaxID=347 RepID=UPI001C6E693E
MTVFGVQASNPAMHLVHLPNPLAECAPEACVRCVSGIAYGKTLPSMLDGTAKRLQADRRQTERNGPLCDVI